jgi:predicted DNA-binding transcriptional regulator AlpA
MELIPAKELSKILGLKPRYVAEKLIHKPEFPTAYRILGGMRKWDKEEILEWLKTQREAA